MAFIQSRDWELERMLLITGRDFTVQADWLTPMHPIPTEHNGGRIHSLKRDTWIPVRFVNESSLNCSQDCNKYIHFCSLIYFKQ